MLLHLLRNVVRPQDQTVVFVATKHHAEYLSEVRGPGEGTAGTRRLLGQTCISIISLRLQFDAWPPEGSTRAGHGVSQGVTRFFILSNFSL